MYFTANDFGFTSPDPLCVTFYGTCVVPENIYSETLIL